MTARSAFLFPHLNTHPTVVKNGSVLSKKKAVYYSLDGVVAVAVGMAAKRGFRGNAFNNGRAHKAYGVIPAKPWIWEEGRPVPKLSRSFGPASGP